jgi:hypothetical protein
MKTVSTILSISAASLLAVLLLGGCRETVGTGRATVPVVEKILADKGREWSLVAGFNPADPKGCIALVGPADRNDFLAERFLSGDVFDNIDGRLAPDDLPDFSGECIDVISDLANTPYESFLPDNGDSLRAVTVRNFLFALDTTLSIGAFDNERLEKKENAKIVVFTSPLSAVYGAFDVDTLVRSAGKEVPVFFPAKMILGKQLDRNISHLHVAVLTDSLTAASGAYPAVFDELAAERSVLGCGCVAFSADSVSYAGVVLDAYKAAGGNMPLSAVIVDDPTADIDAIRDSFDWIMRVQSEANLGYRKLIADGFTVVDAARAVTDECYHFLRKTNNFTHNIAYPRSENYITVPSTKGAGYNLVELY